MQGPPQERRAPALEGGRASPRLRWLRGLACCRVEARTLSSSAPAAVRRTPQPVGPSAADTPAPVKPASPGAAATAEEVRDQLRPLPASLVRKRTTTSASDARAGRSGFASFVAATLVGRRSHAMRSLGANNRKSLLRSPSSPARSLGRTNRQSLPSSPLRTMGSLTAWQALAAEVQQAMRLGAAAAGLRWGPGSSSSELAGLSMVSHGRSSQVEPHLIMSEESSALVPDGGSSRRSSSTLHLPPAAATRPRRPHAGCGGSTAGVAEDSSMQGSGEDCSQALLGEERSSGSGDRPNTPRLDEEYEVLGELGRGAFGCALKARRRRDGALVCIKVLDSASMGPAERRMSRDEVRVLSSMAHPNIVLYHECFHNLGKQYIAMEFCEEGDLEQWLKARDGKLLGEGEVMLKFVQLCLALQHVHSKGIIHRDVKSGNIFCTRHGILKLGDFGISKIMAPGKSHTRTMVGTPYYFSPELVEDKPYSKKADVWAAGCVLYELATLQRPFRGSSVSAVAVKILRGTYAPLSEQYSPELHKLLAALLRRKPDHRPTIDEVLGMEYVRRHMRRYRDHVQRTVEHRKQSFFNSLNMFQLDSGADCAAAATTAAAAAGAPGTAAPVAVAAATLRARQAAALGNSSSGSNPRQSLGPPKARQPHRLSAVAGQFSAPPSLAAAGASVPSSPSPGAVPPASPLAAAPSPPAAAHAVAVMDQAGRGQEDGQVLVSAVAAAEAAGPPAEAVAAALPSSAWKASAKAADAMDPAVDAPGTAGTAAEAAMAAATPATGGGGRPVAQQQQQQQQVRPPKATSFSATAYLQAAAAAAGGSMPAAAAAADGSRIGGLGALAAPGKLPQRPAGTTAATVIEEEPEVESEAAAAAGVAAGTPAAAAAAVAASAAEPQQQQTQQQPQQQLLLPQLVSKLASYASLSLPDSPQSALHFQRASSLKTANSEAGSLLAAGANGRSGEERASGPEAAAEHLWAAHLPLALERPDSCAAPSEPETPSARRAADSVVDLARRAPGLLLQVQQLLDRSPVPLSSPASASSSLLAPAEGDAAAEGRGRARRLTRRAADQGCSEELRSFALADDSAGSTPGGAPRLRASAVWGGGDRPHRL